MEPTQAVRSSRKSLAEFGYEFNAAGQMRSIDTGEPFKFEVSESRSENQKHYEDIGEVITGESFWFTLWSDIP